MSTFIDVKEKAFNVTEASGTGETNNAVMAIGQGSNVWRADASGMWMGADKWADAPFRVDMLGNVYIKSPAGNIIIDAINNRIIINDGTDDIILLGYQLGGF